MFDDYIDEIYKYMEVLNLPQTIKVNTHAKLGENNECFFIIDGCSKKRNCLA